jgi:hypothetical protein
MSSKPSVDIDEECSALDKAPRIIGAADVASSAAQEVAEREQHCDDDFRRFRP